MKQLFFLLMPLSVFFMACPSKITKPKYMEGVVDIDQLPTIENKFERFRQQILGHFSNREQVDKMPSMREAEQEFIITPIFKNRPDEFWVYLEFFSPGLISRPLDQRIEQYVRVERDTFRMEVYYLKNPEKYVNEWKKDVPFKGLSKSKDLVRDTKCDLFIVPQKGKSYHFRTVPQKETACEMKVNNGTTKYVDLFFDLSDAGYNMRFKFYDKDKKMLRETSPRGIDFKRLDYKNKEYPRYDIN